MNLKLEQYEGKSKDLLGVASKGSLAIAVDTGILYYYDEDRKKKVVKVSSVITDDGTSATISGDVTVTGSLDSQGVVSTAGYTVAALPAGTVGDRAYVTDALTPTFLGIATGGGAVVAPVFYDGSNWIIG